MMPKEHSQVYGQMGRGKRHKTMTIEIGENDIVFIKVPGYRLPTIQQLSGTTFSIKLYPLD